MSGGYSPPYFCHTITFILRLFTWVPVNPITFLRHRLIGAFFLLFVLCSGLFYKHSVDGAWLCNGSICRIGPGIGW